MNMNSNNDKEEEEEDDGTSSSSKSKCLFRDTVHRIVSRIQQQQEGEQLSDESSSTVRADELSSLLLLCSTTTTTPTPQKNISASLCKIVVASSSSSEISIGSVRQNPRAVVNRRLAKQFEDRKWYYGTISGYFPKEEDTINKEADLWNVVYDDSDKEDLDLEETVECLRNYEARKHMDPHPVVGQASAPSVAVPSPNPPLTTTTTTTTTSSSFAQVDGEDLMSLVELLEKPVRAASLVSLLEQSIVVSHKKHPNAPSKATQALDQWLKRDAASQLQILQRGLQAAQIVLHIAATPHVDKRAVNEDAIAACIYLVRTHFLKNLLPALNQTAHIDYASLLVDAENDKKTKDGTTSANMKMAMDPNSPAAKRRRSSAFAHYEGMDSSPVASSSASAAMMMSKDLKKVYKLLLIETVDPFLAMMERLEQLVPVVPLDDELVFSLTSTVLRTLELDPPTSNYSYSTTATATSSFFCMIQNLQLAALSLLSAAFGKYPSHYHRFTILEDLLALLPKLPMSGKKGRTVLVSYASVPHPLSFSLGSYSSSSRLSVGGTTTTTGAALTASVGELVHHHHTQNQSPTACIQMLTALILQLLLATVERPTYVDPPSPSSSEQQQEEEEAEEDTDAEEEEDDDDEEEEEQQQQTKKTTRKKRVQRKATNENYKKKKTDKKENDKKKNDNNEVLVYQSGLNECFYWANEFVGKFVQRCLHKSSLSSSNHQHHNLHSDVDYRPLLSLLVEDLLSIWMIPEYSVAEVLLVALTRRLTHDIVLQSSSNATTSTIEAATTLETTYLNAAFEQLGRMAAAQARLLAEYRGKALVLRPSLSSSSPTPASTTSGKATPSSSSSRMEQASSSSPAPALRLECYCGSLSETPFCVACDICGTGFHGPCVGLTNRYGLPSKWKCDACTLTAIHRNNNNAASGGFVYDEAYALQQAYLAQLALRENEGGGGGGPLPLPPQVVREVTRFQMARWADRLAAASSYKTNNINNDNNNNNNSNAASAAATALATQTVVSRLIDNFWEGHRPGDPTPAAVEELSEEGSNRLILSCMVTSSPFLLSFKSQIKNLIRLLGDEKIHALRRLSLKAIEKTIEGDPQLMVRPTIICAVSRRLSDDQISVREAALSLVGAYVAKSPEVASSFQKALLLCLTDVGVSVRKRCVKIFQEILTVEPRFQGRSEVCSALLRRAADPKEEDAVRDLIHELFLKLWLQDGDVVLSPECADNNTEQQEASPPPSSLGVVTPTPKPENGGEAAVPASKKAPQTRADVAAEQMMEVVRADGSAEHLETLLRELLRGASDNDKGKKQAERNKRAEFARNHCDRLVYSLFELLLSIEERRSSRQGGQLLAKDLAAALQSISTFAELSPTGVLRRLDAVLPYLKADNGVSLADEQTIVTASCDILFRLTGACGPETATRATNVSGDLQRLTYNFSSTAMEAAIRALSSLAAHQEAAGRGDFDTKLLQLTQRFYKFLVSKKDVEDFADAKIRNNTHRALTALGFVCEYRVVKVDAVEWEHEVVKESTELIPCDEFNWEKSLLACYRVFRCFLDKKDPPTKCSALHALAGMFVSQPRLMLLLEQDQLIDDVMSDEADVSLQLVSLQCWRRILLGEEKRIDGGKANEKMDSDCTITTAKRIAGDQDGDASLFGGILTNHAARLFELTQTSNPQVRYASLDLIGVLLKQGQLNPNDAVPYLFALQGDSETGEIRSLALRLLMREGEKRPDMLRQRICAGVKRAYDFQRAIYPDKEVSSLKEVRRGDEITKECVFSNVYKECVVKHRKQRHGLYANLLSLFDVSEVVDDESPKPAKRRRSVHHKPKASTDVDLLCFVSQILAHLPYEASGDPLFIINKITSTIWLLGSQIVDRFASLLRPIGLASSDELDESNSGEDALERAARVKFPSRTEEAKKLLSPEFHLDAFTDLCRDGAALTLLLRLKSFLRQLYNLSELRCIEYDPDAKESIADRGISKSPMTKAFDSTIGIPSCSTAQNNKGKTKISMDHLIRHYAEFRRLMRAEVAVSSVGARAGTADLGESDDDNGDSGGEEKPSPPQQQPLPRQQSERKRRSSSSRKRQASAMEVVH